LAGSIQQQSSVRNRLLAALSPEDWARLEPQLEAVELPFDQTIHAMGGPVDAVFFVETGMVSLIVTLERLCCSSSVDPPCDGLPPVGPHQGGRCAPPPAAASALTRPAQWQPLLQSVRSSGLGFLPSLPVPQHGVQHGQQLPRHRDQRHHLGLPGIH
jgi:hypothetical protein